jgi:TPR repeat protein
VPTNLEAAVKWYRKSAEQNQAAAQYELGNLYLNGEGIKRDHAAAAKWFRKAAAQDHAGAMNNLGYLTSGTPEAAEWYRKAAEKGLAKAQANLGVMYGDGSGGLRQDLVEAYKWFLLSSGQNDPIGKRYALDYEDNDRLTPDQVKEAERRAEEFRAKHRNTKP